MKIFPINSLKALVFLFLSFSGASVFAQGCPNGVCPETYVYHKMLEKIVSKDGFGEFEKGISKDGIYDTYCVYYVDSYFFSKGFYAEHSIKKDLKSSSRLSIDLHDDATDEKVRDLPKTTPLLIYVKRNYNALTAGVSDQENILAFKVEQVASCSKSNE